MSKIIMKMEAIISLELTEGEAGALAAICGYGPTEFLNWFERNMGKHYIAPYKGHVKTLFDKARSLESALKKIQKAREEMKLIQC